MSDKRTGKKTRKLAIATAAPGEIAAVTAVPAAYVAVKAKKAHRK